MKIISKYFTTNFFEVNEATAQIRGSGKAGGCGKWADKMQEGATSKPEVSWEWGQQRGRQWGARLAGGRSKQRKVREEMKEPWLVLVESEETSAAGRTWVQSLACLLYGDMTIGHWIFLCPTLFACPFFETRCHGVAQTSPNPCPSPPSARITDVISSSYSVTVGFL